MLKLLGTLHFNVALDDGSLVGSNIEVFRWVFGHVVGVFVQL